MSAMLEEAAKAMYEARISRPAVRAKPPKQWDELLEPIRRDLIDEARAVLTRLREPTPGMVEAGLVAVDENCALGGVDMEDAFRAMIDAAMEGK